MAIFKCKMCGGALEVGAGKGVITCEYCETTQTLPRLDDERRANLYDRANHYRRNNDYDKAMREFEKILDEDKTDFEAYWSIVLCRYGIEYVKDPQTGKYMPTINRMQKASVIADADYKAAIEYADDIQKQVLAAEANAILAIQKEIAVIVRDEKPFDIFICYKETDAAGRRSRDSVLAQELYGQLTNEGFKVFFARITLEDKLGSAYEPYIFSALNSSKVMVVIGTCAEHFNAVWVKNEWSRYLALIQNGEKKVLIPAYKDMDPYDMPEEFSHLQAQDMDKLGFMQDLVRGINKIVGKEKSKPAVAANTATTDSMLKRAFMFMEDGDWDKADQYCEKVLDIQPENAMAWLGKMMIVLKVRKIEMLSNHPAPFIDNGYCKKALRYADDELKAKIIHYNNEVYERITQIENETKYRKGLEKLGTANDKLEKYQEALACFRDIGNYKDAEALRQKCYEKIAVLEVDRKYARACELFNGHDADKLPEAKELFESVADYENAAEMAAKCESRAEEIRNEKAYNEAAKLSSTTDDTRKLTEAMQLYESISGWKDAAEKAKKCKEKIERLQAEKEAKEIAEAKRVQAESRKKKLKKNIRLTGKIIKWSIIIGVPAFAALFFFVIKPNNQFKEAVALYEAKEYMQSYEILSEFDNKVVDEAELIDAKYKLAQELEKSKEYYAACVMYDQSGTKEDSEEKSEAMWKKVLDSWKDKVEYSSVANDSYHAIALKNDGTVVGVGRNDDGECDVSSWTDIISVDVGLDHSVGLKSDGTVVAVGDNFDRQCEVSEWKYIVAVYAHCGATVGLRGDGTVVTTTAGKLGKVDDWEDIIDIKMGTRNRRAGFIVGLKSDGTVVAAGKNEVGECDVTGWTDIEKIFAEDYCTVGIKKDGTFVITGSVSDLSRISDIDDAVSVCIDGSEVMILRENGEVVSTVDPDNDGGKITGWEDIKQMCAVGSISVALTKGGKVKVSAYEGNYQLDLREWSGIDELYYGYGFVIGRKKDGSFVTYSRDQQNERDCLIEQAEEWTDIKVY